MSGNDEGSASQDIVASILGRPGNTTEGQNAEVDQLLCCPLSKVSNATAYALPLSRIVCHHYCHLCTHKNALTDLLLGCSLRSSCCGARQHELHKLKITRCMKLHFSLLFVSLSTLYPFEVGYKQMHVTMKKCRTHLNRCDKQPGAQLDYCPGIVQHFFFL